MNRFSRFRHVLFAVVIVLVALPSNAPNRGTAEDEVLAVSVPDAVDSSDFAAPDAQGLKVLTQIAAEKTAFKPNLSGAERPTPQQYARCALDRLQKRSIKRILFSVKLSKYALNGSWDCTVQF